MEKHNITNLLNISLTEVNNISLHDSTNSITTLENDIRRKKMVFLIAYMVGIIGNAMAIVALRRGEKRVRNRKLLLLLTSLAANDLVALIGMMALLIISLTVPHVDERQWFCMLRVVLRVFGVGSVCIAVTMAMERYLALTRPFTYQKQVTYYMIRTTLLISWFAAALLTCAPVAGIGIYYDPLGGIHKKCKRYREALTTTDVAYAIVYVIFGTSLCLILVFCNLAVIKTLYSITAPHSGTQPVMRRVSKSSCKRQTSNACDGRQATYHNAATVEEVAFSRLMATLSVLFMICWLPNMVTSLLYLTMGQSKWAKLEVLSRLSDGLMLMLYVLNPFLYVLMRRTRNFSFGRMAHALTRCFKQKHQTSSESVKTSCCQQETMLVSDSSSMGVEMRIVASPAPLASASTPLVAID